MQIALHWWQIGNWNANLEREPRFDLDLEEDGQREWGLPPEEARHPAM